jgi:hypothetical protein
MEVGDMVTLNANKYTPDIYRKALSNRYGIVIVLKSRNWVKVMWSDGKILKEHVDDLKVFK